MRHEHQTNINTPTTIAVGRYHYYTYKKGIEHFRKNEDL